MTRLLFVEGVSGVGKSTLTRALADSLSAWGMRVRAYLEFDCTNPIDFYATAYLTLEEYRSLLCRYGASAGALRCAAIQAGDALLVRYYEEDTPLFPEPLLSELAGREFCWHPTRLVPLEAYTTTYQRVWENFAAGLDGSWDVIIFDGSLLHHPLNDMMRNYRVTGEQAAFHVKTLLNALGKTPRRIAYLQTGQIKAQLERAHLCRKQPPPTRQEVEFWETRYQNDRIVLDSLAEECHILDVSNGEWRAAQEQIERLFDPPFPPGKTERSFL